ncbi:MAG: hypothetical protein H7644_04355 [Candidatus Heimdallarchaeota archaeon]|nr:hypothetical protein [Candidatus Heimdallarchaeota archaeon]MCK5142977.1 hypothetical protein [Candidatus Heimdallarchaeota archaeon]
MSLLKPKVKVKKRNISVTLPDELIDTIDDYKYQNRMSRNAVVKKALEKFFEEEEGYCS